MNTGIVTKRYAKALLAFAKENKAEHLVYDEMRRLAACARQVPLLHEVMTNPVLRTAQKAQALKAACTIDGQLSATTERFIDLLVSAGRGDLYNFVAHSYATLYRRDKGIVSGSLVVPCQIDKATCDRLQALVEKAANCHVDMEVVVDPTIEGGFILSYDTYRCDASLRTARARILRALG